MKDIPVRGLTFGPRRHCLLQVHRSSWCLSALLLFLFFCRRCGCCVVGQSVFRVFVCSDQRKRRRPRKDDAARMMMRTGSEKEKKEQK